MSSLQPFYHGFNVLIFHSRFIVEPSILILINNLLQNNNRSVRFRRHVSGAVFANTKLCVLDDAKQICDLGEVCDRKRTPSVTPYEDPLRDTLIY